MSIHEGHRTRLKDRFISSGLDAFSDFEALELILFYALPRRDTNEIAHHLINRFKSLPGVLEADIKDLQEVTGIGENAAILIRLIAEMNMRYLKHEKKPGVVINGSEDAGRFLIPYYSYISEERAYILCLDSKGEVLSCRPLANGSVNRVDFSARTIVDIAMRENAVSIVLSHNHVSGTALPSKTDLETTRTLYKALSLIGVKLADHIVVCEDDFVSMLDSGYFLSF